MEKNVQNNAGAGRVGMQEGRSALCRQCSNHWRDVCLVTRPEMVCSKSGINKCSHYFKEKMKPKINNWAQV